MLECVNTRKLACGDQQCADKCNVTELCVTNTPCLPCGEDCCGRAPPVARNPGPGALQPPQCGELSLPPAHSVALNDMRYSQTSGTGERVVTSHRALRAWWSRARRRAAGSAPYVGSSGSESGQGWAPPGCS